MLKLIASRVVQKLSAILRRRDRKIFCIGLNKTGTTSLELALKTLGFRLGNQRAGELLIEAWGRRDFRPIIRLAQTADAFQDVPFSLNYTYQAMDIAFPGSRFILTVRDSAQAWYHSMLTFTAKRLGCELQSLAAIDIRQDSYIYPGWHCRLIELQFGSSGLDQWFNRDIMLEHYLSYNQRVLDYFRHRPQDLLVLNVGDPEAMGKLCEFLGVDPSGLRMPHLNRSS